MKILIITKIRFKKYKEKIKYLLDTYAFKTINETCYIGNINSLELKKIEENINNIITKEDTILIIYLTPKTVETIITLGKQIQLEEKKYNIL